MSRLPTVIVWQTDRQTQTEGYGKRLSMMMKSATRTKNPVVWINFTCHYQCTNHTSLSLQTREMPLIEYICLQCSISYNEHAIWCCSHQRMEVETRTTPSYMALARNCRESAVSLRDSSLRLRSMASSQRLLRWSVLSPSTEGKETYVKQVKCELT